MLDKEEEMHNRISNIHDKIDAMNEKLYPLPNKMEAMEDGLSCVRNNLESVKKEFRDYCREQEYVRSYYEKLWLNS